LELTRRFLGNVPANNLRPNDARKPVIRHG
jgi:hypothetical protein